MRADKAGFRFRHAGLGAFAAQKGGSERPGAIAHLFYEVNVIETDCAFVGLRFDEDPFMVRCGALRTDFPSGREWEWVYLGKLKKTGGLC